MERKALGRGLSSLVGGVKVDETGRVLQIPIDEIRPNPQQPRQEWDDSTLSELANSIRLHGVLQPLIIRGRPGAYELVAGERRLRASRLAGLTTVPVLLRETDDEGSLKLALIENIQREDISPLDAAQAYQHLMDRFGMTQEEIAQAVGKSRPAVANALRPLRLPFPILESLRSREITEGHARTLLSVKNPRHQEQLWLMARDGASVREMEAAARGTPHRAPANGNATATVDSPEPGSNGSHRIAREPIPLSPHLHAVADQLRRKLSTRVEIRGTEEQGTLTIEYYSSDELQALVDLLLRG